MADLIEFLNARIKALETENQKLKQQVNEAKELLENILNESEVNEPEIITTNGNDTLCNK